MYVFIEVADTGTQFISSADLVEERGYYRIFCHRTEVLQSYDAVIQCLVGVVGKHLIFFYDEPCRTRTGVFPVDQYIADHLTQDLFTQIYADVVLKKELFRQVLYSELNKHFIAFNQVGHHSNPVIVPVNVHFPHNGIGFISGEDVLYHQIFAEQQHCSSIEAIGIIHIVSADQFGTA